MDARWEFVTPPNEPSFWARAAEPNEIDGWDPISGLIVAHTIEERERLSDHQR